MLSFFCHEEFCPSNLREGERPREPRYWIVKERCFMHKPSITEPLTTTGSKPWPTIPPQAWSRRMDEVLASPSQPVFPNGANGGHVQGAPLGGLGTGGIGRDYYGGFSRWTVKAGCLKHFCEPSNFFATYQAVEGQPGVARILYPDPAPDSIHGTPGYPGWQKDYPSASCSYHALFPKAWYHYRPLPDMPVELVCEQFSPLIPNNYRDSSLPVGLFVWHARNTGNKPVTLSILFNFANMVGWFNDFAKDRPSYNRGADTFNTPANLPLKGGQKQELAGILFNSQFAGEVPPEGHGQMCIAARASSRVSVSRHVGFHPPGAGDWLPQGKDIWNKFASIGRLDQEQASFQTGPNNDLPGALAATIILPPGETCEIPMTLVWDLPVIAFGSGRRHFRQYTKHIGASGKNAAKLAAEALERYGEWSQQIDAWHHEVISRGNRPDWYYSMLFNESYLLVDGYTVWTAGEVDGSPEEHFGIIECPDYAFYNTIDLWIYGSFSLLYYWPEIEKLVVRRLARLVDEDDPCLRTWLWKKGELYPNKAPGAVPHDFGTPGADPFFHSNSYYWQNTNIWRDLNAQFVLIVYRDYFMTKDAALLQECWPAVKDSLARLATYDADGDGLIENTGSPDQTFDSIALIGPGVYCNSLWLGALACAEKMAQQMHDTQAAQTYQQLLAKAKKSFDTVLWNGSFYRTDTQSSFKDTVFLEQLFGVWYAELMGVHGLVAPEKITSSARVAYEKNFLQCLNGRIGAKLLSNVSHEDDSAPKTKFNPDECQIHEALSGINMAFACHLLHAGMKDEAFKLLAAVYRVIYQEKGLWFRTPAAWNSNGDFRAIMNLRPLVIWAMEHEYEMAKVKK